MNKFGKEDYLQEFLNVNRKHSNEKMFRLKNGVDFYYDFSEQDQAMTIYINPSNEGKDWIVNFNHINLIGKLKKGNGNFTLEGGSFHYGYTMSAIDLHSIIEKEIGEEKMAKIKYKIFGYSQGAGVGYVLAWILFQKAKDITLITYGCPGVVLKTTKEFDVFAKHHILNFVYGGDAVYYWTKIFGLKHRTKPVKLGKPALPIAPFAFLHHAPMSYIRGLDVYMGKNSQN